MICGIKINSVFFDYADKDKFYQECQTKQLNQYNNEKNKIIDEPLNKVYQKLYNMRNHKLSQNILSKLILVKKSKNLELY